MVHWKRDLDLYTIGRPLERNAGFWLDYMRGLKGEYGDKPYLRRPLIPSVPSSNMPRRALSVPPLDLGPEPSLLGGYPRYDLPLSPAYDELRDIIDRARRRHRQQRQLMIDPFFY